MTPRYCVADDVHYWEESYQDWIDTAAEKITLSRRAYRYYVAALIRRELVVK